jgi:hypothetical protein
MLKGAYKSYVEVRNWIFQCRRNSVAVKFLSYKFFFFNSDFDLSIWHINKYILIRYLDSIAQALSAYFGLESRECKCLEYLFIIILLVLCGVRDKIKE